MSDVEQLEAMASVDVPEVVAADNANDNGSGVNDVEDAAVNHVDVDVDVDDEVTGSYTAQINDNWVNSHLP